MTVGERIKHYRIKRGLTLEELADRIGVRAPTILKYETGFIKNIPHDKIEALSNALLITPSELCGWVIDIEEFSKPIDETEEALIRTVSDRYIKNAESAEAFMAVAEVPDKHLELITDLAKALAGK